MDPLQLLHSLGGVARSSTLREAGLSKHDLRLLAAQVRKPKRGLYALPECRQDFLTALMHNAVLTCASAAEEYGLWLRNPSPRLHLSCEHGHVPDVRSLRSQPTVHRGARYPPHHTLPIASLEDVVFHALRCLPVNAAVPLVASALRQYGLRRELLEQDLAARKCGTSLRRLRLVDTRVESLPEAEAFLLLAELAGELGVEVVPQALVPGVGRVDFLIAGFLIVEIDGVAYHSDRASVRRDRRRDNSAILEGYLRLRYLPEEIWTDPERFVAEVRTALTGRPTR
ncbi:DUF559 domain-containing protein [Sinomonas susongensis]|uniref:DUF559 domain-containing protein n=1 Tax=Sinomonas susongensis TaxID=1324851 RepID=UPI001108E700|nr:DUF559 domain-containing protein [Sinomonas susongensis]